MKRAAAGLALLPVLLAGCGSTVQLSSTRVVGQGGLGAAPGAGQLPAGDGTSTAVPGGAAPAGTSGSTAAAGPAAAGLPGTTSSPLTASTAPAGRGLAAKEPVRIGVITQQQLDNAARSIGLDGVTTGDTKGQVNAVVAWLSAHGGLAGHPIKVYEYAVDLSDGSNDAIQSKACTAMTQDYKVRFVITVLGGLNTLTSCLAKHGVGLLADNTNMGDATIERYAATLAHPSELAPGRMSTLLVDALVERGWLTRSSKIGLLVQDNADWRAAVTGPLTAALRRHGLTAASTVYIDSTTGDGGNIQSSSAVLRFRSAGVDRVIPAGYSPLYMMIAAESQGYRPAYAMVSANGPGALLEGTAPRNQLKDAAGIGWAPFLDIGKGPKPPPVSSRETLCFDIMRKGGQAATSALVKGFEAQICDLLFYLKDLADLEPALPQDLLTSARVLLGKRFVSPATYRVDVTHRTDGVAGYRPLAFLDGCGCFQYTGPVQATS